MVSFNVIGGDTITKILLDLTGASPDSIIGKREFTIAMTTLLITMPLSLYRLALSLELQLNPDTNKRPFLYRNVGRLAKASFLSIIFVTFILITIVVRAFTMREVLLEYPAQWEIFNLGGTTQAVGIMAFGNVYYSTHLDLSIHTDVYAIILLLAAFICHHNSFLLYCAIENRSEQKWSKVTHISILTSTALMLVFALGGYGTFTGQTQGMAKALKHISHNFCVLGIS